VACGSSSHRRERSVDHPPRHVVPGQAAPIAHGEDTVNIDEQEALRIAHEDAARVYVDLDMYTATAQRDGTVWRVTYSLRTR